jgi:hypothetical protein
MIRKMIPLSIGTHGGGQQEGPPVEEVEGGGAGAAKIKLAPKKSIAVNMNFKCLI